MRHLLTDLRGNIITARRPNKRVRHPHLPQLFYLVQNRSWDAVMRRSASHSHEITLQEETSLNTPLHIAVRLDPPGEVVKALLPASTLKNAEGSTPLHLACTHRVQSDVIRVLLQAETNEQNESDGINKKVSTHPTAILTRTGRAPIHYACMSFRGLSVEAFQILLDATLQHGNTTMDDPDDEDYMFDDDTDDKHSSQGPINVMTLRDSTGQTPLGLLFRRYRERVRCVIKSVERLRLQHNTANSNAANIAAAIKVQADLGELWAKARIIVGRLTEERLQREGNNMQHELESPGEAAVAHEAAKFAAEQYRQSLQHTAHDDDNYNTTVHSRHFRIVHASVGLTGYGCPPEMIRLAISIHPTQVHEMDEEGNLPLHIAAVASSYVTCSPAAAVTTCTTSDLAYTAGHQLAPPPTNAARPATDEDSLVSDISGLWSVATTSAPTTNAFDKVIKILLNHYPAAARIPHGKSGRLPLLLAIEAKRRTYDDGIRTLLEAFPAALAVSRTPLTLFPYILAKVNASRRVVAIEGFPATSNKKTTSKRSSSSAKSGLNTLFELVKAKPELVKYDS